MITGPCNGPLSFEVSYPDPDFTGKVGAYVEFTGDGVSLHENGCDGDVTLLRYYNSSDVPGWVYLPDKKKGSKSIQIPPGTNQTITSPGQLNTLGLTKASDIRSVKPVFADPGV